MTNYWFAAFTGMTERKCLCAMTEGWIPIFMGMTDGGAGMTEGIRNYSPPP